MRSTGKWISAILSGAIFLAVLSIGVAEQTSSAHRDFTRILFATNWGRSGTGEVEMFLIELPPDWSKR